MIKTFRKSKRLSSNSSGSPKKTISRVSTSSSNQTSYEPSLQSPKKVIKALYDYEPQGPGELKFSKGDFFHVLSDPDDEDYKATEANGWVEATNPMTHIRGMVPISYFEVFDRSRPIALTSNPPKKGDNNNNSSASTLSSSNNSNYSEKHGGVSPQSTVPKRSSNQTLYAVTLYEFKAERDDELDVVPNENLIICAHHGYEWFIAKPINRLGGPGLVPVSYVKIIDLLNPNSSYASIDTSDQAQVMLVISGFNIPTVEQWKDQTAKYQASSIPLGSISSSRTPPMSATSQYFDAQQVMSDRSSDSSTTIVEASVDSYQLDHGRYQYLITARLSNGKIRYLYRYYQDFYDLQVKLLDLFPYEAGKMENSKRIIPSIPGPLINVNDSISKLRREKLDYYLSNLIALPAHISRCDEVLRLFEVLDNGFDREADAVNKRYSKPISQKSTSHQDRLSQYSNFNTLQQQTRVLDPTTANSNDSATLRSRESSTTNLTSPQDSGLLKQPKVKVKFYFDDDIFVLLLPTNLRLQDLKTKLFKRLELEDTQQHNFDDAKTSDSIHLFLKNDFEDFLSENNISSINMKNDVHQAKLQEFEVDDDEKFQSVLFDKCKLMILVN
ncbi:Bud emergence protein 1 [Candida viswanathii]|uniref:Bud emergence protein 1 n=1 Tax=Candida viswanathii TaxID=5486 RepID=A0A367Y149_9ASCO|nr:Bud emergence protein 1 [Candida viswanathii]